MNPRAARSARLTSSAVTLPTVSASSACATNTWSQYTCMLVAMRSLPPRKSAGSSRVITRGSAAVAVEHELGHVGALVIGRLRGEVSRAEGEQLLRRVRRAEGEPLVGEDVRVGRVIDHVQPQVIEVRHLVHRLGDLDDVLPALGDELPGFDL